VPILARTNSAIFDLAHLATLSGVPGHCLFVSPKTLYILQNLVVADVISLSRYARVVLAGGYYIPCEPWSDEYPTVLEIIEGVETEVIEMPCYAYTGVYSDLVQHTMTESGAYVFDFEVPENELWEVQGFAATNSNRDVTIVGSVVKPGPVLGAFIQTWHAWPVGEWACWTGKVVLSELQKLRITIYSNQVGDAISGAIHVAKLVLS